MQDERRVSHRRPATSEASGRKHRRHKPVRSGFAIQHTPAPTANGCQRPALCRHSKSHRRRVMPAAKSPARQSPGYSVVQYLTQRAPRPRFRFSCRLRPISLDLIGEFFLQTRLGGVFLASARNFFDPGAGARNPVHALAHRQPRAPAQAMLGASKSFYFCAFS